MIDVYYLVKTLLANELRRFEMGFSERIRGEDYPSFYSGSDGLLFLALAVGQETPPCTCTLDVRACGSLKEQKRKQP